MFQFIATSYQIWQSSLHNDLIINSKYMYLPSLYNWKYSVCVPHIILLSQLTCTCIQLLNILRVLQIFYKINFQFGWFYVIFTSGVPPESTRGRGTLWGWFYMYDFKLCNINKDKWFFSSTYPSRSWWICHDFLKN